MGIVFYISPNVLSVTKLLVDSFSLFLEGLGRFGGKVSAGYFAAMLLSSAADKSSDEPASPGAGALQAAQRKFTFKLCEQTADIEWEARTEMGFAEILKKTAV